MPVRILSAIALLTLGCSLGQPAPSASPAPTREPRAAFLELAEANESATYSTTLEARVVGQGQVFNEKLVFYVKPPLWRSDLIYTSEGRTETVQLFRLAGDRYASCARAPALACVPMAKDQVAQPGTIDIVGAMRADPDGYDVTYRGSRTVIGEETQCFVIRPSLSRTADFTVGIFCYTREGVLLFEDVSTSAGRLLVEATQFSGVVNDADLRLPAPLVPLPTR